MTEPDHAALNIRRRRLLFRATHRGTFENDLMIGGFVRAHLASLTEADLDALEAVMEIPDTDLADWLTGRVPIPPRRTRRCFAACGTFWPDERSRQSPGDPRSGARRRAGTPSCSPSAAASIAGPILHVTRDDARMARLAEALAFVLPEAEILRFPAWDCLPYDRVSPNPALVSERVATLTRLLEKPTAPAHRADHGERAGAARAAARRLRRRQHGAAGQRPR